MTKEAFETWYASKDFSCNPRGAAIEAWLASRESLKQDLLSEKMVAVCAVGVYESDELNMTTGDSRPSFDKCHEGHKKRCRTIARAAIQAVVGKI